jgi:hypothetical protein
LIAQARMWLAGDVFGESRRKAGLADPRLARDQHNLPFALPGEALAFPQEVELVLASQRDGDVFLYAFDLIELNGDDLRRDPLQVRKDALASILAKARPGQSTLRGVRISAGRFERRAPA